MHTPIVALISADPSSRAALEHALGQAATLLVATTTEAGLRLLDERRDLTLVVCDDSGGRIARKPVLATAGQVDRPVPVIVLGDSDTAGAALSAAFNPTTGNLDLMFLGLAATSVVITAVALLLPNERAEPIAVPQPAPAE